MKNPRISVTVNANNAEMLHLICKRKKITISSLFNKILDDWLEDYEDVLLAKIAEEAEMEWISRDYKTISHEEVCRQLGINQWELRKN